MGQSRNEDILENILGAQNPLGEPQSREEALLMQILEQGGGGGSSTLAGLTDVSVTSPSNEQILKYDSETGKWVNDNIENEIELSKTAGPSSIVSFISETDMAYKSVIVDIQATGGNGTPDNPNPINGYSSANITRCGVNLWDEEWELGYYNGAGAKAVSNTCIRCKNQVRVSPNTTYYIKTPNQVGLRYYDYSGTYISGTGAPSAITTFTTPNDVYYMTFYCEDAYGTIYNNDISINYPSTDTAYHAYNGQTYTIAFGQTVYGGVLDVTRGKLTFNKIGVIYDGSPDEKWVMHGSGSASAFAMRSGIAISNINIDSIPMANYLEGISRIVTWGNYDNWVSVTADKQIVTGIQSITDVDVWKTYLSNNPLQVVYDIVTPFDIDLTPEVISAIVGTNNVFADCGETTVGYYNSIGESIKDLVEESVELWTDISGTLEAGETEITLTNSAITTSSTIEVFNNLDVPYVSKTVSAGSITLTFDEQDSDMSVKVRVS